MKTKFSLKNETAREIRAMETKAAMKSFIKIFFRNAIRTLKNNKKKEGQGNQRE